MAGETIRDLFNSGAGAIGRGFELAKEKAADGATRMKAWMDSTFPDGQPKPAQTVQEVPQQRPTIDVDSAGRATPRGAAVQPPANAAGPTPYDPASNPARAVAAQAQANTVRLPEGAPTSEPYPQQRVNGRFGGTINDTIRAAAAETNALNAGRPVAPYPNTSGMPGGGDIGHTIQRAAADSGLREVQLRPAVEAPAAPAAAQPTSVRTPNTPYGDAFRAQGGSAEAQAFRAGQTARAAAPAAQTVLGGVEVASPAEIAAARGPGGLRGMLNTGGKLLRGAGIAGAGLAAIDAADKAASGQVAEQRTGTDAATAAGIEALNTATFGLGRPFVHAVKGGLDSIIDPRSAADVAADPRNGLGARIGRFANKVSAGWREGAALDGAQPSSTGPLAAKSSTPSGDSSAAPDGARKEAQIPTLRGSSVTPDQAIKGSEVPVAGTGAFQRTTPGNRGEAVGIDTRSAAGEAARGGYKAPRTWEGGIVRLKGEQQKQFFENKAKELGIRQQQADAATAKAKVDIRDSNRKIVEDRVKATAGRDPELTKLPKEEREARIAQRAAEVSSRMDYSLGRRNAGKGDASPAAINDFLDADKWRDAVVKSRNGLVQNLRDFFGHNQFNSDDSFSYRPAYVDKGGRIYTENGNNIGHKDSYLESNWFSPNKVDADMRRYVENLPTEEQYKAKKGAK